MRLSNLFKRLNTNVEDMELELSRAYEKINILEGELSYVHSENSDLRDEMEAMTAPQYD